MAGSILPPAYQKTGWEYQGVDLGKVEVELGKVGDELGETWGTRNCRYPEAWGVLLREMREAQDWTQRKLAHEADVNMTTVSHWENGRVDDKAVLSREQALRLAHAFAGRQGGLESATAVCDWLGLIGRTLDETEMTALAAAAGWSTAPERPAAGRYQVAPLPTPYVERTHLLNRARAALLANGYQGLVLLGMAGAGKSTVAGALAMDRAVRASLPHGVLWAAMGPGGGNAQQDACVWKTLACWAQTWRLEVGDDLAEQLRRALEHKRALIVVDGAEEPQDVLPLLVGGPSCRIIVTTRNRDLVRHLPTTFAVLEVGALDQEEEEYLLQALLGAGTRPSTRQELADFAGGNVRGLLVAAREAQITGLERLVHEMGALGRGMTILSPAGVVDPERNLSASLALSYERLRPEEQRCFRALTGLGGPYRFTQEMLATLTDVAGGDEIQAILHRLVDASLVESHGRGYRLPPLLYEYSYWLAQQAGEEIEWWLAEYEGGIVRKWRRWRPSVPLPPGVTRARGWRERLDEVRILLEPAPHFEARIVEAWDLGDAPMAQFLTLLQLIEHQYPARRRITLGLLGAAAGGLLLGGLATVLIPNWAAEIGLWRWLTPGAALLVGAWAWLLGVMQVDLYRLWLWAQARPQADESQGEGGNRSSFPNA